MARITEGFRICRKCGCTVHNEFIYIANGLMCDACSKKWWTEYKAKQQSKVGK